MRQPCGARGLAAVQNSKNSKNDTLYRQARAVFDRNCRSNRNAADDPAIFSIFQQLALAWCLANQANDDAELWCDMGDMHSRHHIADYYDGCGVTQSYEIAEVCYRKAAERGNERGQWELGWGLYFYKPDRGIQEKEQAFYWMEQAAQQGNAFMLDILRDLYDINRDCDKAVNWFRKSAE